MHWLLMVVFITAVPLASVESAAAEGCRWIERGVVSYSNRCVRVSPEAVPAASAPKHRVVVLGDAVRRGQVPDLPLELIIDEAARQHGVSKDLISAVIRVESDGNPHAVSRKGARGLMQLMPGTASQLGVWNPFDPWQNVDGGVRHLRGLLDRFGGDAALALAGYNAGENAVMKYGGIPPYDETRAYVHRVLSLWRGQDKPVAWQMRFVPNRTPAAVSPPANATPTRLGCRWVDGDGVVNYANHSCRE